MLCIPCMIILGDHNIKKVSFQNFNFRAAQGEELHKQVVYQSPRSPPPPPKDLIPKWGENHINTAYNMLYIPWMVILCGHNIIQMIFQNFDF